MLKFGFFFLYVTKKNFVECTEVFFFMKLYFNFIYCMCSYGNPKKNLQGMEGNGNGSGSVPMSESPMVDLVTDEETPPRERGGIDMDIILNEIPMHGSDYFFFFCFLLCIVFFFNIVLFYFYLLYLCIFFFFFLKSKKHKRAATIFFFFLAFLIDIFFSAFFQPGK